MQVPPVLHTNKSPHQEVGGGRHTGAGILSCVAGGAAPSGPSPGEPKALSPGPWRRHCPSPREARLCRGCVRGRQSVGSARHLPICPGSSGVDYGSADTPAGEWPGLRRPWRPCRALGQGSRLWPVISAAGRFLRFLLCRRFLFSREGGWAGAERGCGRRVWRWDGHGLWGGGQALGGRGGWVGAWLASGSGRAWGWRRGYRVLWAPGRL